MPELPEVETVVRSLQTHIDGFCIEALCEYKQPCFLPGGAPLEAAIGRKCSRLFRRGKLIVMELESSQGVQQEPLFLVTHLRMTGALMAYDAKSVIGATQSGQGLSKEQLQDELHTHLGKHSRAWLVFGKENKRCFVVFNDMRTFGRMFLASKAQLDAWSFWANLGPEPLEISQEEFAARLRGQRAIKTTLMDQKVLAGIGNIYADESLFAAHIAPTRPTNSLSCAEKELLYKELQRLLRLSIEQCGSSIRNYMDADGNVGAFQNTFAVYGKAKENCRLCGHALKRLVVGGRGTTFCPHCQK